MIKKAQHENFTIMATYTALEVPFFQRAYVWDENDWEHLFKDLKKAFDSNKQEHFLGTIFLKQIPTDSGRGDCRLIIDGQQRFTTFSILLKALLDRLNKETDEDLFYDTKRVLYTTPRSSKKDEIKIKHSRLDREEYSKIFQKIEPISTENQKQAQEEQEEQENNLIWRCYETFSKWLDIKKDDEENAEFFIPNREDFLDFILKSKSWVVIDLAEDGDEQIIFDSINSLGVKLTAADIIKNALFSKVRKLEPKTYLEYYKEYWEKIFELNQETKDFWFGDKNAGAREQPIERFLHIYAVLKEVYKPSEENKISAKRYKDKIREFQSIADVENFLKDLPRYTKLWRDFYERKPKGYSFDGSLEAEEDRLLLTMQDFNTYSPDPLILRLKDLLEKKPKELQKCFHLITSILFINKVSGRVNPSKNYFQRFLEYSIKLEKENTFEQLKKLIQTGDEHRGESYRFMPTREEVIRKAINAEGEIKINRARIILFWVELYLRKKIGEAFITGKEFKKFSVEHIFPQTYQFTGWKNEIKEDEKNLIDGLIHQIGNLTLLPQGRNSEASNKLWDAKKEIYKKPPSLLITNELLEIPKWNAEEIQKRNKRLMDLFFEIWNYD